MTTASASRIDSICDQLNDSADPQQICDALEKILLEQGDYHRLFDARLIRVRQELGLPITQPTSLESIPAEHQAQFREAYVAAAREIGRLLLDGGQLADAWAYFRTIGEPDLVQEAIDKISIPEEPDEAFDEVMNVALYEGAHVVKGLEFLLATHGTCNTVTTLSQLQQQMSADERRQAAAMLVRRIYSDLQHSLKSDLESRNPGVSASATIRELISGQSVLFAEGNYHIDVSHLHSVVGFARALTSADSELQQAVELCEYGCQLSEPLQYPGNPPFEQYYDAHRRFLTALLGHDVQESLDWFINRMNTEADENGRRLVAFVILDLGQRTGHEDTALASVAPVLSQVEDPNGFSFTTLCVEQGRLDLLEQTARSHDDVIAWATARLAGPADQA